MINIFPGDSVVHTIIFNLSIQMDPLSPVEFSQFCFVFFFSVSHFLFFLEMSSQSLPCSLKKHVFLPFYLPRSKDCSFSFPKAVSSGLQAIQPCFVPSTSLVYYPGSSLRNIRSFLNVKEDYSTSYIWGTL